MARSNRTNQAPGRPSFLRGKTRDNGDPVTNLRRTKRSWTRVWSADATQVAPRRRSVHAEVGRGRGTTIVTTEGNEGVGGLHK